MFEPERNENLASRLTRPWKRRYHTPQNPRATWSEEGHTFWAIQRLFQTPGLQPGSVTKPDTHQIVLEIQSHYVTMNLGLISYLIFGKRGKILELLSKILE